MFDRWSNRSIGGRGCPQGATAWVARWSLTLVAALLLGLAPVTAQQPSLPTSADAAPAGLATPDSRATPERATPERATSSPWGSTTTLGPTGDGKTTVIPRSQTETQGGLSEVQFVAQLTDDGHPIEQGLVWSIFAGNNPAGPAAPPRLLRTVREARPILRLAPGTYIVNVAFGRAHLTRTIEVGPNQPQTSRFVLNAGGLRVTVSVAGGRPIGDSEVSIDVLSGEPDQLGERRRIVSGARPGLILRLNAGIYRVVSTYGDANAIVRSDVSVEAGKLTEVTVNHLGAVVTFRLVARPGGEAESGVQWAVMDAAGNLVKESAGAVPRHVLAAGSYVVAAQHGGRTFRRGFTVTPGVDAQVEVVMQ